MADHPTGPVGPDQARTKDSLRTIGIVVVGLSAAVLSFQTWVEVAQSIGFTAHWSVTLWSGLRLSIWIAWLYPVTIDCFAMLVTREWIRSRPNSDQRAWARANSIGAIALSYGGQAAYHAFDGHIPPTAYVVFMGGMPPLIVGLVVHLYTKSNAEAAGPDQTEVDQTTPTITTRTSQAAPVQPTTDQPAGPIKSDRGETDRPRPTKPARTTTPARPRHGLHVVQGVVAGMADQIDQEWSDQIPSREKVMRHFGWRSASQTGEAIRAVRTKREAATEPADDAEEPDRAGELVGAGVAS